MKSCLCTNQKKKIKNYNSLITLEKFEYNYNNTNSIIKFMSDSNKKINNNKK